MGIKLEFDSANNPMIPQFILTTHKGNKLGLISHPYKVRISDSLMDCPELSFSVNKESEPLWDQILDFKLIYVVEWDVYLEIHIEISDGSITTKNVTATGICKSELSQTLLYGLEFNTEDDILSDEYERRSIYNSFNKETSILSQIMEKAPHYTIKHVDASIANLFKIFSFDAISIDDAIIEICAECKALPIYNDGVNPNTGMPAREISLYDLETICNTCGYRGDFNDVCPECGSTNLEHGYGKDTTIFISKENLTEEIVYSTNVDSVKNTFKLIAGDDTMTLAVKAYNPNGTDYIQYFNRETMADMPDELVEKIESYDKLYNYYQKEHIIKLDSQIIENYNILINKYSRYNDGFSQLDKSLIGYASLMNAIYDVIDFELYLESGLMPIDEVNHATIEEEVAKLTSDNLSPIGLDYIYDFQKSIIDPMVLSVANYIIDKRFNVEIKSSVINTYGSVTYWVGVFTVTDYSDETKSLDSDEITLVINKDTETYIRQRINKILSSANNDIDYSINKLLSLDTSIEDFKNRIIPFNTSVLQNIKDTCMTCMDTIQSKGFDTLSDGYYSNYRDKLDIILAEITTKDTELKDVIGVLKDYIIFVRNEIQNSLNIKEYLGEELYKVFCSYRREDIYQNEFYISDGLTNKQIFENAMEFYKTAEKEIYKSAVLQHSISSTLKNFLAIPEFVPLREYFELGNWLRIEVDGVIYKLRLTHYEIDFDELQEVVVGFSDVTKTSDGITDVENLLNKTSSMASSYGAIVHQVNSTASAKKTVQDWITNGLDATITKIVNDGNKQDVVIDNHGILIREYDDITETYHDNQMKFINSVLAITDDDWKSIRTALGNYTYQDPISGEYKEAYGLIGESIVGNLILGKILRIHNESNNMIFDENGLNIYNDTNSFRVDPNSDKFLKMSRYNQDMLWFDASGMLHIEGDGAGLDIKNNSSVIGLQTEFRITSGEIRGEISNTDSRLNTLISQVSDSIRLEVHDNAMALDSKLEMIAGEIRSTVTNDVSELSTSIVQTANEIMMEVARIDESTKTLLSVNIDSIKAQVADFEKEISSTLIQKENLIYSQIYDAKNEYLSSITETKNQIELQVYNFNSNIHSTISQTENNIKALVANEVDHISSMIEQKDNSIKLYVQNEINGINSSIEINSNKIGLLVGDTVSLTATVGAIAAVAGDSSITLSDATITAIANQAVEAIADKINLYGLVSIEGLDPTIREKIDNHAIFYSSTAPTGAIADGDVWYQEYTNSTDQSNVCMKCFVRSNGQWIEKNDGQVLIENGTIVADLIASEAIDSEKLSTDAIKSRNFPSNAVTDGSDYSTVGTFLNLSNGAITSKNFRIDSTGNVSFKGNLTAGMIGGLYIEDGEIFGYRDNSSNYLMIGFGNDYPMVVGENPSGYYYYLDWDGSITCNGIDARSRGSTISLDGNLSQFDRISCEQITLGSIILKDNILLLDSDETTADGITFTNSASGTSKQTFTVPSKQWVTDTKLRFSTYNDADKYYTFRDQEGVVSGHGYYVSHKDHTHASSTSDERLKNIIKPFDSKYKDFFMKATPFIFTWKDNNNDKDYHWGFGAQNLEKAIIECGIQEECSIVEYYEDTDIYKVKYPDMPALNWYITQENVREIEFIKQKLDYIENRMLNIK